jgi:UDP-N-acetylglucosamine--N-acetylmuramyl-(pentapeptide) pyrophosphoryl-undecaprenol N-acetylglucosamine transferase
VLHEHSVAGMVNKVLASVADRVFTAFPDVLKTPSGSAIRCARGHFQQAGPADRFTGRTGL